MPIYTCSKVCILSTPTWTKLCDLLNLPTLGNKLGDVFPSYFHENIYIRIFGGLLTLFQTYGVLLTSLKPLSTQKIHDPSAPHLTNCFDMSKISLTPLGSGRKRFIKELEESDTFCSYLRDPPK